MPWFSAKTSFIVRFTRQHDTVPHNIKLELLKLMRIERGDESISLFIKQVSPIQKY